MSNDENRHEKMGSSWNYKLASKFALCGDTGYGHQIVPSQVKVRVRGMCPTESKIIYPLEWPQLPNEKAKYCAWDTLHSPRTATQVPVIPLCYISKSYYSFSY